MLFFSPSWMCADARIDEDFGGCGLFNMNCLSLRKLSRDRPHFYKRRIHVVFYRLAAGSIGRRDTLGIRIHT